MASLLAVSCSLPSAIRASSGSSWKPDPNRRKAVSSSWWTPLFGWSSDPDYISKDNNNGNNNTTKTNRSDKESGSDPESGRPRSKLARGCFTEEKARQLRRKMVEGSAFHDVMYHSAIASRLASDLPGGVER